MNEAAKILQLTDGGFQVFCHYLGDRCRKKIFHNPYREDTRPSCHLYRNKDKMGNTQYYLQDFGDSSFCGNCFTIVGKLCHINPKTNFKEILQVIDRDMSLFVFDEHTTKRKVERVEIPDYLKEKQHSHISFFMQEQGFKEWEIDYWRTYGIDLKTLSRYHVKSVKSIRFEREEQKEYTVFSSQAIPMYGYCFNDGRGIKIYRPNAKIRFMYAGELPRPYVFGWEHLSDIGDTVFITGGEKDVLSLASHGFEAVTFNSETANIPEGIIEQLSKRFEKIVFLFDSDETGKKESLLRVNQYADKYNVKRIVLPLSGTKKEKDISDFFKLGHTREELNELLNF